MIEVKLQESNWFYDEKKPLGETGGFGQVFEGRNINGDLFAVKRLKIEAETAGHRELKLADDLSKLNFDHVIKIHDYGIDAESGRYFIVMEMADYSLQNYLNKKTTIPELESTEILKEIAAGLKELKGIIHRDIKPANILFHKNKWKIADFGIARFVEESTSLNTLKECLSPHYAAPEQWRLEKASKATDIYALGIIAHEILSSSPPFNSDRIDQLREMHLKSQPPRLNAESALLKQVVLMCLRKSPESRPSIDSLLNQLQNVEKNKASSSKLAEAGVKVAEKRASKEAERVKTQTKEQKRKQLAKDAFESFNFIINELFQHIKNEAPIAEMFSNQITLGSGRITVTERFNYIPKSSFPNSNMDIVCGSIIEVTQDPRVYKGRSSNLWYMKRGDNFRWVEIAYWTLGQKTKDFEPYAVENQREFEDADYAASNVMHSVNHAFHPKIIDGEHMDDFIQRWAGRLANASSNNLGRPMRMPEE